MYLLSRGACKSGFRRRRLVLTSRCLGVTKDQTDNQNENDDVRVSEHLSFSLLKFLER